MCCNSCQPSYIFKPKMGKHFTYVAFSDKCSETWDLQGKATVRPLCSSLVSTSSENESYDYISSRISCLILKRN